MAGSKARRKAYPAVKKVAGKVRKAVIKVAEKVRKTVVQPPEVRLYYVTRRLKGCSHCPDIRHPSTEINIHVKPKSGRASERANFTLDARSILVTATNIKRGRKNSLGLYISGITPTVKFVLRLPDVKYATLQKYVKEIMFRLKKEFKLVPPDRITNFYYGEDMETEHHLSHYLIARIWQEAKLAREKRIPRRTPRPRKPK